MHRLFIKGVSLILILSVFFTFSVSPALAAITYTYDANGNMLSDGDKCYHYNEANQMDKVTKCSNGQTIAEYVYDYTGLRLVKKEFENGVLKRTIYSPADEFETVKQASNGATANTNYYNANDELIAKKNPDGSITYYHNDHLGSSAVLSDQTGAVVEKTSYEPYGEVKSGGTKSKFGYTGQEKDSESGLNYYDSRYYDPHIQRFIQPDTWLPDVYDPQQLNRYAYANNNPLKYTDPSGHVVFLAIPLVWWVVGAAVATASVYLSTPQGRQATEAATSYIVNTIVNIPNAVTSLVNNVSTTFNKIASSQSNSSQKGGNSGGNTGSGQTTTGKTGGGNTGGGNTGGGSGKSQPEMKNIDPNRNPAQDRKMPDSFMKKLEEYMKEDIHDYKGNKGSKYDVYMDKQGNLYQKLKGDKGPGEALDINRGDLPF